MLRPYRALAFGLSMVGVGKCWTLADIAAHGSFNSAQRAMRVIPGIREAPNPLLAEGSEASRELELVEIVAQSKRLSAVRKRLIRVEDMSAVRCNILD